MRASTRAAVTVRATTVVGLAVVALAPAAAHAQQQQQQPAADRDPSPTELAASREQFQVGVAAARAERWEQAREAFERAYAIVHRPLILLNLAGAQVQTGRFVVASENYRRFLREATTPPASEHRADAQQALAALEPRIPHATLRVATPRAGDEVRLDGHVLHPAAVGVALPVDPGEHTAELFRDGRPAGRASFRVDEAARREVELTAADARAPTTTAPDVAHTPRLDARAQQAAWAGVPDARAPAGGRPRDTGRGVVSSPWFWVATGAAVLVVGGAVVGVYFAATASPPAYTGSLTPGVVTVR